MKLNKAFLFLSIFCLLNSCASKEVEIIEENVVEAPVEIEEVEVIPEPTPEELYIESLANIKLDFIQIPKTASYNKNFSSSYKLSVTDSLGAPLSEFAVTMFYPSTRNGVELEYTKVELFSNEEGIVEFTPEPIKCGINDFIIAYPTPAFESDDVYNACLNIAAKAQIKVRSDIVNKGCLLFIWDFNEKNRPVNNSYEILSELRSYGITLSGNAPVNESSYIGTDINKLYKQNYEIVEDAYGYLICGTIKFVEPVSQVDDAYNCKMIAEITAVNMKNGNVQIEKTFTKETTGKNWTAVTSDCKEALAQVICEELVYGL